MLQGSRAHKFPVSQTPLCVIPHATDPSPLTLDHLDTPRDAAFSGALTLLQPRQQHSIHHVQPTSLLSTSFVTGFVTSYEYSLA